VLVLIILTYSYKVNGNQNKQLAITGYCIALVFLIIIPFFILRFFPSDFSLGGIGGDSSNVKCFNIETFENKNDKDFFF
ncbi:unnamed protein product, partial [marine sediment metagenome]